MNPALNKAPMVSKLPFNIMITINIKSNHISPACHDHIAAASAF